MWAPKVSKSIPFDVVATAGGRLAIGYARDTNDAVGLEVDPRTGEVRERFAQRAAGDIDRVVPSPDATFAVALEGAGPLRQALPVPLAQPFVIGTRDGTIAARNIGQITEATLDDQLAAIIEPEE